MARKRKQKKLQKPLRPVAPASGSKAIAPPDLHEHPGWPDPGDSEEEVWYSLAWRGSRSGARASRGFHFQEAVGAWLASRIMTGRMSADRLIPEGLDDLQLDAVEPVQFEIKSRQGRRGPFRVKEAAQIVATAWSRHSRRFGATRRLVVVLEQGFVGWDTSAGNNLDDIQLSRLIDEVEGFKAVLIDEATSIGLSSTDTDELASRTALLKCSWDDLIVDTHGHLASMVDLPPAALAVIRRDLWAMVSETIDTNAEADLKERAVLTRNDLVARMNDIAQLVDLQSIEYALKEGICSLIDTQPLASGDGYYEGISTQPGHVGAGLVVPRPDLVEQVMAALEADKAVLLTGPSGVGKSAVLWTLPFAFPGVLWFRVNRVHDGDMPHVVRMIRAHCPSTEAAVGLLVDAAGTSGLEGWSRLREAVATVPGVHLVGSARNEDLFSLGTLADCSTVRVSLDETAAETIHAGLIRRGATKIPHWREAFEKSDGLTLEYTHLLTQGTRLNDIVVDQIADRIHANRGLELRVLALVSTADRWSVPIPFPELESITGAGLADLRATLERLVDEHLLTERNGMVTGIHPVRSRVVADAIHRVPPPQLETTVISVLKTLRGAALSSFLYQVLRDEPHLEAPILRTLQNLAHGDLNTLLDCLSGLDLVDFSRQASAWMDIAGRYGLPPADTPLALDLATLEIECPGAFPENYRAAVSDMIALPQQSGVRDALLELVGTESFQRQLADTADVGTCRRLLRTIARTSVDCAPLAAALKPDSQLVPALRECSLTELCDCVSAARAVSPTLARLLVEAIGGTAVVMQRMRTSDPWIQELQVVCDDSGNSVAISKFLYISESDQHDAQKRAVEIGSDLLRCLPDIEKVDIKAIVPGGLALTIGGHEYGVSKLSRSDDHHPDTVGLNQERMRLARSLFGVTETERLAEAEDILAEVATLVQDIGNAWVRQDSQPEELSNLRSRRSSLSRRGRLLPHKRDMSQLTATRPGELIDPLAGLITGICDQVLARLGEPNQYPAIRGFVKEAVLEGLIPAVRVQPWRLLGRDATPDSLDQIVVSLSEMLAVLREFSVSSNSMRNIISIARNGTVDCALTRAAKRARTRTARRVRDRRRQMVVAVRSIAIDATIYWNEKNMESHAVSDFVVAVPIDSVSAWLPLLDRLIPKVDTLRVLGEYAVLLPMLNGKTVLPLAEQLILTVFPVSDLDEFEGLLPEPLEQRLTKPITDGHNALRIRSGLSMLRREGTYDDRIALLLTKFKCEFDAAIAAISEMEQDVVVTTLLDWLKDIEQRVAGEVEGKIDSGSFARELMTVHAGNTPNSAMSLLHALMLSLQWDANPADAIDLMGEMGEMTGDDL